MTRLAARVSPRITCPCLGGFRRLACHGWNGFHRQHSTGQLRKSHLKSATHLNFLRNIARHATKAKRPPPNSAWNRWWESSRFARILKLGRRSRRRVSNQEMPPKGARQPAFHNRMRFVEWVEGTWRTQACAADLSPAITPVRRLNRDEYSATVRDLFDIQVDLSERFPVDGAGGEGFDNAAETLFISPLLAESTWRLRSSSSMLLRRNSSRERRSSSLGPERGHPSRLPSRRILERFLPAAFRRPVDDGTLESYGRLFRRATPSRTRLRARRLLHIAKRACIALVPLSCSRQTDPIRYSGNTP